VPSGVGAYKILRFYISSSSVCNPKEHTLKNNCKVIGVPSFLLQTVWLGCTICFARSGEAG
jgi:hypothetical protein